MQDWWDHHEGAQYQRPLTQVGNSDHASAELTLLRHAMATANTTTTASKIQLNSDSLIRRRCPEP